MHAQRNETLEICSAYKFACVVFIFTFGKAKDNGALLNINEVAYLEA